MASDEMETLSQAMNRLLADGYDSEWNAVNGALACSVCGETHPPGIVTIDEIVRFEGISDPGDESILYAVTGPCGAKGLYVAPYGVDATPDDIEVQEGLDARA